MIRRLVTLTGDKDVAAIKRLSSAFALSIGLTPNTEFMLLQAQALMKAGIAGFWAYDKDNETRGMIGAVIVPSIFDGAVEVTELFWFMEPEYRTSLASVRLMKMMMCWAKDIGAKRVRMGAIEPVDRLEHFYLRQGFTKFETSYIKDLA
jgi:N-acetylglutamate synthase-like GNAT family acetyltransferase